MPAPGVSVTDAVAIAAKAGGVAVLAHPGRLAAGERDRVLGEALEAGIDGVEVWHSQHDAELRRSLAGLAERTAVRSPAGGSDYHGRHKPRSASAPAGTATSPCPRAPCRPPGPIGNQQAGLSRLGPLERATRQGAPPDDRAFTTAAALAALVLAVATALALSYPPPRQAGAIVSATPNWVTRHSARPTAASTPWPTWATPSTWAASFTQVNGQTLAGWPPATPPPAGLLGWNPSANGVVRALKVSPPGPGCTWAGDFTAVGGASRAGGRLSPTSGGAFGWSPYVNDSVKAVTTSNSGATVYVGGDFDSAEGAGRRRLAAFNATSGNISTTFKPSVSNGTGSYAPVLSMDVSPDSQTLYFSGDFALVNGTSRRNAAAVSTGIATLRAWSPASTADIAVSASGNTVFVGGRSSGGYVQAYGPTAGGTPVWNVATNGDVEALAISSSISPLGGHFTAVGGSAAATWPPSASGGGLSPGTRGPTVSSAPSGRPSPARGSPSAASSPWPAAANSARAWSSSPGPHSRAGRRVGTRLIDSRPTPPPPRQPRSNASSPWAPPRPTSASATSPGRSLAQAPRQRVLRPVAALSSCGYHNDMDTKAETLLTSGQVARELDHGPAVAPGRPPWRSRRRRGNRFLFDAAAVQTLPAALGVTPTIPGLTREDVLVLVALGRRPFGLRSARAVARAAR